jgi:hypothetical protein
MKRLLTLLLLLMPLTVPSVCKGQSNPQQGHGAPSGVCLGPYNDIDTGNFYTCKNGLYNLSSGGGITSVTSLPGTCAPGGTNAQVNLTTGGQQGLYTCTATNTYTYTGASSNPTGVVGKVFNATDAAYGLSTGNTAAANNTALTALSVAINAYTGGSNADYPVVYIPGGSSGTSTAVYSYSGGLSFTRPVTLECGRGAVLNYTGAAHEADFGATGLTPTTLSSQQASSSVYDVEGCTFTGGASATEGLFFNQFVFQPRVHNNTFFNNTNNGANVFSVYISPNISACDIEDNYFNNQDNTARNGIRVDATSGFSDQCHVVHNVFENTFFQAGNATNTATNFGIGIWVDGQGSLVSNNNMGFCAPCIRVGPGPSGGINGTRIANNYLEGPGSAVATPIIQYGDPGSAAFVDSLFIIGNFILANNAASVMLGPASATTGLTNTMMANNRFVGTFAAPFVQENDVAGQTGNSFWDNICGTAPGSSCAFNSYVTISGNVTAWQSPSFPFYLADGTTTAPPIAFASHSVAGIPDFGFTNNQTSNNEFMEVVGNPGVNGLGLGVAAQNASNAYAGFFLIHPNDAGVFPNRGFTIRHIASVGSTFADWENGPINFYTAIGGALAQRWVIKNTGDLAMGAGPTLLISQTVPTIAGAGCGGSAASIVAPNGTAAFKINVGTTPGSACTVTMPTATTGWSCSPSDITTQSTSVSMQKQTGAESTTSVIITNFSDVTVATAFVANDIVKVTCSAY